MVPVLALLPMLCVCEKLECVSSNEFYVASGNRAALYYINILLRSFLLHDVCFLWITSAEASGLLHPDFQPVYGWQFY